MKEKLKLIKNLLEKRSARRKEKAFVVEGPHLVEEALLRSYGASEGKLGGIIKFIVYCEKLPIVKTLEDNGTPAYKISKEQYAELSRVETPQGVLAVVREFGYSFRDVIKGDKSLIVFCLGVQDPGNLGTIIRSADAFGASGIILSKGTVDLYNPKVIRSSMGSLFHLPIVMTEDEKETLMYLKEKGVKIITTEAKADKICSAVDLSGPVAIVLGNEGEGVSIDIVGIAAESVRIPMVGQAESLNVGMSASVLLYEVLRQRGNRDV